MIPTIACFAGALLELSLDHMGTWSSPSPDGVYRKVRVWVLTGCTGRCLATRGVPDGGWVYSGS